LPIQKVVQYATDTCNGLAAAHDLGIVHRDLKPENLFVTRGGYVKILDFGLAKLTEAPHARSGTVAVTRAVLTSANAIMGTAGYMSPEQVSGRTVDHRSDIFSLGAVLYELMAGTRAFAGDSAAETASAILNDDPAEPASTDAVSAGVFTLVRHCLQKEPAQRFQSARDLAFALDTVASVGQGRESSRKQPPAAIASEGPHRLVVLPFENLSPHGSEEWLAGALADSLTFGLRNVEHIIIVNRQHAGVLTDPQQLFETLAVRYCVKGSFQQVGDDLKVFVRLIHADTGTIAIQESLTDHFSNLLSLEETIASRFAAAFERTSVGSAPGHTSSLAAYKRLSQGRESHLTGRYAEAAHHLEIAVRRDAECADAWALLANSYARLSSPATSDENARIEFQRKALAAAERAARLNPALYESQIALALAYRGTEDVELWRTAALKAIELNPRLAEAYVLLGQSYFASPAWGCARHRESELAERYFRKALQIDPHFGLGHNALIHHLRWANRPTEALHAADEAIRVLPDHVDLLRARAMTLVQLGRLDEAEEQVGQLALEPTNSVQDEWALAAIDLLRGRFEPGAARLDAIVARGPRVLRSVETAFVYCHVGNFPQAAIHLQAACSADPACATFVTQCPAFTQYRDHPEITSVLESSKPESAGDATAANRLARG
jgi:TolB-like protein